MKLRNLNFGTILLAACLILFAESTGRAQVVSGPNQLTNDEVSEGWVLLFDGKTNTGWRGANKEKFPEKGWEFMDGMILVTGERGGDIITEKKYSDFDLKVEFRVKEHEANSGIKYYVLENEYREGQVLGLEFQTARLHPGTDLETTLGSLYEILPPNEELVNSAPLGEWNQVRIVSKKNMVQHWLNGNMILEYKRGGKAFREGVASSKFKDIENFGEVEEGHILLQDHNNEVAFRNIKIREL